jgi:hypothetical protein
MRSEKRTKLRKPSNLLLQILFDSSRVDRVSEKGGYILTLNKGMFVWLTASDKSISQWLARLVRDLEVYITVSFCDLRRGVAQWRARFVRDEEAGGSSPLTPTIFSLYIVTRMTVLTIISPFRKF